MTAPRYANDLTDAQHAARRAFLAETHVNPNLWPSDAQETVAAANRRMAAAVTARRHEDGRR